MVERAVTFVMAARNAEGTIRDSIESILQQNFARESEIIVVDDASTDRTAEIVSRFGSIRLIRNSKQLGRSASRNRALHAVRSAMVAIQDADDIALPNRLSATVGLLLQGCNDVVGGQAIWVDPERGAWQGPTWPTSRADTAALLRDGKMPVAHPTLLMRTSMMQDVGGYDESLPVAEDLDLMLRLAKRFPSMRVANTPEAVTKYSRRAVDPVRYVFRSAYWTDVVHRRHLGHNASYSMKWIRDAAESSVRQRVRILRTAMNANQS